MATVYYKPAEIIHWLGTGSRRAKESARLRGRAICGTAERDGIGSGIKQAAGAVMDIGRGALADFAKRQAEGTTYALNDEAFETHTLTGRRRISYSDVSKIQVKNGDRYVLLYDGGSVVVKPIAHLVAGSLRVPIGWTRNGMEVPYALLIEELTARCGVDIEPS